jgi:hypothetical protein
MPTLDFNFQPDLFDFVLSRKMNNESDDESSGAFRSTAC